MSSYTGTCCCVLLLVAVTELVLGQSQTRCGDATQGGTAGGADCVFPFEFKGTNYDDCTDAEHTKPWCYTAADKSAWGECIFDCEAPTCPIATKGGNAGGANCVFPFTYNGSPYYTCTSLSLAANTAVDPWCAITASYDADQKWGQCIIKTSRDDKPCVFPFTYNGQGPYTECVSVGCDKGSCDQGPWCGVDTDGTVEDSDGDPSDWGYCNGGCDPTTTVELTTPTISTTTCQGGACVDPTTPTTEPTTTPLPPLCPIPTTGGTSGGEPCVFPFIFSGIEYSACITTNYDKPWCATVANYDTEGAKWGECLITDTKARPCVFPFDYGGETRKECIVEAPQTEPWCAISPTVDATDAEVTWGFCALPVQPDCPEPSTSTTVRETSRVTGDCVDTFEHLPNTLSYLGEYEAGVMDVPQCQGACMKNADCQAFDWNRSQMSCYLHKGPSYLQFVTTSNTVDQYRREPCVTTTTTTTTTTEPTTSTTTATSTSTSTTASTTTTTTEATTTTTTEATTSACTDTFEKFPGVNSYGGQQEAGATDEASCWAVCLADVNCAAFDLNGEKCFLHTAGYVDRLGKVAANTQYRRQGTCTTSTIKPTVITPECELPYTMLAETLALGGDYVSGATTEDACKEVCSSVMACIAVDFNTETSKCYWHTQLNDVVTGVSAVNQYRKGECGDTTTASTTMVSPDDCVDTFEEVLGTLSLGGSEVPGTTVPLCQATCLAEPTCIAVDYNKLLMKCFWHGAGYEKSLRKVPNVDQYRRVDCDGTTTQATTSTTTEPTTPTTTQPTTTTTTTTTPAPTTPTNIITDATTPTRIVDPDTTTTTQKPDTAFTCTTGGRFSMVDDNVSVLSATTPTQGFIRTDIDSSLGKTVQDCGQKCCELVGCVALDWRLQTDGRMLCYLLNGGYIENMSLVSEPGSSHYRLT